MPSFYNHAYLYHPLQPSMKRRCVSHDYHSRSMYLITLVTNQRRQIFGTLCGDPTLPNDSPGSAAIDPSPLGKAIIDEWKAIPSWQQDVANIEMQLMPDHLHFILFVMKRTKLALGSIVADFKVRCAKRYRALVAQHLAPDPVTASNTLFEPGFNDKILLHQHELQAWRDYLKDNPRRRLIKELNPDMFRVKHNITISSFDFEAMGNELLLCCPRRIYVQCSRSLTDSDIQQQLLRLHAAFSDNAVFVSPSISPGEKAVMHAAFEHHCPTVVIRENGFGQYEKPGGRAFDACAEGRMLLLAPWQHHTDRRLITRNQCLQLNTMARAICNEELPR